MLIAPAIRSGQRVLLLQLDGKLPNYALMRLSAHCKRIGAEVEFRKAFSLASVQRGWMDDHEHVFASAIFEWTAPVVAELRRNFPKAVVGGTWSKKKAEYTVTLESMGVDSVECDYSLYPGFEHSLGFSQRGCRLNCYFCKVPRTEGKVRQAATIADIWRGDPWPKNLHLLDNDFFGQDDWADRIREIRDGNFKVCFNQGVNVRLMTEEQAEAVCSVRYYDDQFQRKQFYTAWDNNSEEDEAALFRGLGWLAKYGMKPDHVMVYMLIGGVGDTAELRENRRRKLRDAGYRPFPMPYVRTPELVGFQRWVVRRGDLKCSWEDFKAAGYRPERVGVLESGEGNQLPLLTASETLIVPSAGQVMAGKYKPKYEYVFEVN